MRAAILRHNGPTNCVEVGEIAAPAHGRDQILVRVHAAAVNPADVKVCTGKEGAGFIHSKKFPMAFGFDFSGVVEKVGPDVSGRAVGDSVFGHLAYSMSTRQGSFADFVAIKPEHVGLKPAPVSHIDAAAAATVGCTALQALRDKGRLQAGQRVLVNGASGGVGSFAIQIARLLGAEAWGTASAAKADFVRGLGAAQVIDYRETPIISIEQTFDVILDAAAASSYEETKHLLNPGGTYVTLLPSLSLFKGMLQSVFANGRCTFVTVQSRTADLEQLGSWLAAGELDASVASVFELSTVSEALAALESGRVQGKIAVQILD
jgi:NADPH:quinone reductase-like Zn-dependent oxidoreductase